MALGSPVAHPDPHPGCPPSRFAKFQRGKASKQKDVGEETRDKSMMRNYKFPYFILPLATHTRFARGLQNNGKKENYQEG